MSSTPTRISRDDFKSSNVFELARSIDPMRITKQLRFGGWTFILSLIAASILTIFVRMGPGLDRRAAAFVDLVLFGSVGLAIVASLATLGPLIEVVALERLRRLKAEAAAREAQFSEQHLRSSFARCISDLRRFGGQPAADIAAQHEAALEAVDI